MAHARLSPSAADRWAVCTASVLAIERARADGSIGPDTSSDAADEGTAAHEVRAECLEWGMDAHAFVGTSVRVNGKDWPITDEVADHIQTGIDLIRNLRQDGPIIVEQRVALDPWLPGQFGTVDCAFLRVVSDGDFSIVELVLSDLKFGFAPVEAERNLQQQIYALGVLRLWFSEDYGCWPARVRVIIDQPQQGGIKEWVVPAFAIKAFGEWIEARGQEALSGNGVFVPGEKQCFYCPLKSQCDARIDWLAEGLFEDDGEVRMPAIADVKRKILLKEKSIRALLTELRAEAWEAAMRGEPWEGFKLVLSDEGDRVWSDEARAAEIMEAAVGDDAWKRKALSPAQIEKLVKPTRSRPGHPEAWADLQSLIYRAPGSPTLVPADHKKPAIERTNPESHFEEYGD